MLKDQDISLLIPTCDRPPLLNRALSYYQPLLHPEQIWILDSSSHPQPIAPQINHLHFERQLSVPHKIAQGLSQVKTKYSVLCADDDFLLPHAITQAITFLEDHDDYVLATGMSVIHSRCKDIIKKHIVGFGDPYPHMKSLEQDSIIQRLHNIILGFRGSSYYAVYRTQDLQDLWQRCSQYAAEWGLNEMFGYVGAGVYGKLKVLPLIYQSREVNRTDWYTSTAQERISAPEKVIAFKQGLIKLCQDHGVSHDDAKSVVDKVWQDYSQHSKNKAVRNNRTLNNLKSKFTDLLRYEIGLGRRHLGLITGQGYNNFLFHMQTQDQEGLDYLAQHITPFIINAGDMHKCLEQSRLQYIADLS